VRLFLDTSAFVKRYLSEPGTDRVLALTASAESLGVSVLVLPEAVSTLRRLVREHRLRESEYAIVKSGLVRDLADADVCDLTPGALERAVGCLERHALRALDALHIGCAHAYRPDLFVSADQRQCDAARAEGLVVEQLG
jgi:uncharacterized protein